MDIQEAREAFERRRANALNVSYEGLKANFDENSRLFGTRYNAGSINEKEWNLWLEAWQAKAQAVPEKDAVIKKLSDQLYEQEMKTSAARVLCETACELLDDYAHQDAMVIQNDMEQAMSTGASQ